MTPSAPGVDPTPVTSPPTSKSLTYAETKASLARGHPAFDSPSVARLD
jgi:hypothetical protein